MFLYLFGYFLICLTDLFDLDPLLYLVIYCSFKIFLYNAVHNFSFKSFLDILEPVMDPYEFQNCIVSSPKASHWNVDWNCMRFMK